MEIALRSFLLCFDHFEFYCRDEYVMNMNYVMLSNMPYPSSTVGICWVMVGCGRICWSGVWWDMGRCGGTW
jgi:hypothetical protein